MKINLITRNQPPEMKLSKEEEASRKEESLRELQKNQQQKLEEMHIKSEGYQRSKNTIFEGEDVTPSYNDSTFEHKKVKSALMANSKLKVNSPVFDPEFIRESTCPPGLLPFTRPHLR